MPDATILTSNSFSFSSLRARVSILKLGAPEINGSYATIAFVEVTIFRALECEGGSPAEEGNTFARAGNLMPVHRLEERSDSCLLSHVQNASSLWFVTCSTNLSDIIGYQPELCSVPCMTDVTAARYMKRVL